MDNHHSYDHLVVGLDQIGIYGYQELGITIESEIVGYTSHKVKCQNCQRVSETSPKNKGTTFALNALLLLGSLWYAYVHHTTDYH